MVILSLFFGKVNVIRKKNKWRRKKNDSVDSELRIYISPIGIFYGNVLVYVRGKSFVCFKVWGYAHMIMGKAVERLLRINKKYPVGKAADGE